MIEQRRESLGSIASASGAVKRLLLLLRKHSELGCRPFPILAPQLSQLALAHIADVLLFHLVTKPQLLHCYLEAALAAVHVALDIRRPLNYLASIKNGFEN